MRASSQIRNGKCIYGKCDQSGFCTFVKHNLYYLTTNIVTMVDHIGVLCLICNWMREMEVGVLKMIKLDGDITKVFLYGLHDPSTNMVGATSPNGLELDHGLSYILLIFTIASCSIVLPAVVLICLLFLVKSFDFFH